MVNFRVNDDEVALIKGFRLLTQRQRQMILSGVIGITSSLEFPRLQVVAINDDVSATLVPPPALRSVS